MQNHVLGLLDEAVHLQPIHLGWGYLVIAEEHADRIVAQFLGVAGFAAETAHHLVCHPFRDGLGGEVVETGHAVIRVLIAGTAVEFGHAVDVEPCAFDNRRVWMSQ